MKLPRMFCAALLAGFVAVTTTFAADVAGTWTWSVSTPNGQVETKLTVVNKDGKLSGHYSNNYGESEVSKIVVNGDEVSFDVVRTMGGTEFTLRYSGKLSGDAIDGTIEMPNFTGGDGTQKLPWHAKRASGGKPPTV